MSTEPSESEAVSQFIVYGAYGEVMHQFQVFEMVLWGFLTRGIKAGSSLEQAMERVERWNSTTLGSLWRGLRSQDHWPSSLVAEIDKAVDARNFLAHHFLREYFLVRPSVEHRESALVQLTEVSNRLSWLTESLKEHSRTLKIPDIDELGEEVLDELEALRPTSWLTNADNENG